MTLFSVLGFYFGRAHNCVREKVEKTCTHTESTKFYLVFFFFFDDRSGGGGQNLPGVSFTNSQTGPTGHVRWHCRYR